MTSSSCLRYYKVTDPAGWVNVDVNTGELKVANTIDREAPHVVNGIYNITMKAVDASKLRSPATVTQPWSFGCIAARCQVMPRLRIK